MDSVIDTERARALVQNDLLWPKVSQFLWNAALIVHPSRTEALLKLADGTTATIAPSESPLIKRYILNGLGIEPYFCEFPAESPLRLALLDPETLASIANWLGVLSFAGELRKVMDGAKVRELKAAFPGIYPEAFAYTAYFRNLQAAKCELQTAKEIADCGMALLWSVFKDLPAQIVRRIEIQFPLEFIPPAQDCACDLQTIFLLLKLKFPEAYKLCSS